MYGGITKRILRKALVGIMPEVNRLRRDELSLTPFFRRGLAHEDWALVGDALTDIHPLLTATVRKERLPQILDDLRHDRPVPMLQVWFLICANLWLRRVTAAPVSSTCCFRRQELPGWLT